MLRGNMAVVRIDTVEVWGSNPHVPTILFSISYQDSNDRNKRLLPQNIPQTIQLGLDSVGVPVCCE